MKFLIILFLSFNLMAATPAQRLVAIGITGNKPADQEIIARLIQKCGITFNSAFYFPELLKAENETALACFESKKAELDQDVIDEASRRSDVNTARESLRIYDCTTIIDPYTKLLCQARK